MKKIKDTVSVHYMHVHIHVWPSSGYILLTSRVAMGDETRILSKRPSVKIPEIYTVVRFERLVATANVTYSTAVFCINLYGKGFNL